MNWVSIGSDNGLSPIWRQATIQTNAGWLQIGPLETNFSESLIKIWRFSFQKLHLKISSAKWGPFCSGEISQWSHFVRHGLLSWYSGRSQMKKKRHFIISWKHILSKHKKITLILTSLFDKCIHYLFNNKRCYSLAVRVKKHFSVFSLYTNLHIIFLHTTSPVSHNLDCITWCYWTPSLTPSDRC